MLYEPSPFFDGFCILLRASLRQAGLVLKLLFVTLPSQPFSLSRLRSILLRFLRHMLLIEFALVCCQIKKKIANDPACMVTLFDLDAAILRLWTPDARASGGTF